MPGAINIVVNHQCKLIGVGLPKCGSSTLVETFLRLSGFDPQPRKIRSLAEAARRDGRLAAAGMEFLQCFPDDISKVIEKNPGYQIFSVIRDPYTRIYSAYFNKLNRYTRHHSFRIYLFSRLYMLLGGPKAWGSVEYGNVFAHRFISFDEFLAELGRLGIDIDPHFDAQWKLLDIDNVKYDRLLRIETIRETLLPTLRDFGVPAEILCRLDAIPHANQKKDADAKKMPLTRAQVAQIEHLYREDFDRLGFNPL